MQTGDVGAGTAGEVQVLAMHGSAWATGLGGMLAAGGLNAGLFIGGNHEFVILQCAALPLACIQIQYAASLHGGSGIAWKDPVCGDTRAEWRLDGANATAYCR